jgi:hypothetical protein
LTGVQAVTGVPAILAEQTHREGVGESTPSCRNELRRKNIIESTAVRHVEIQMTFSGSMDADNMDADNQVLGFGKTNPQRRRLALPPFFGRTKPPSVGAKPIIGAKPGDTTIYEKPQPWGTRGASITAGAPARIPCAFPPSSPVGHAKLNDSHLGHMV